jgi:hypothetical protein
MNLGQSQFQDTYFVAGAQLTPFRQLRQIELELRSIESAIKTAEFAKRRLELKLKKLDPTDEEDIITIDEASWESFQQQQLLDDAWARRKNFMQMKDDLLARVPKAYWEAGFEANEGEHWKQYFAHQISTALAMGLPPPVNAVESIMLLPPALRKEAVLLAQNQATNLRLEYGPQGQPT